MEWVKCKLRRQGNKGCYGYSGADFGLFGCESEACSGMGEVKINMFKSICN